MFRWDRVRISFNSRSMICYVEIGYHTLRLGHPVYQTIGWSDENCVLIGPGPYGKGVSLLQTIFLYLTKIFVDDILSRTVHRFGLILSP